MKIRSTAFSVLVFSLLSSALVAQTEIILKQEDSPIQIVEYKAGVYHSSSQGEYIETKLVLKNVSNSKIAVARYRVIAFNSFNEYFDSIAGLIFKDWKGIMPEETLKHELANRSFGVEFFDGYGTGFAFIDAVRFEDGIIWRANRDDIVSQIKEVYESFSGDMITETKKNRS